jgi:menaquinone-specific isochorismate synthase
MLAGKTATIENGASLSEPTFEAPGRLVCFSLPANGITLASFLAQARGTARFFWSNPTRPGLQPGASDKTADQTIFAGFGIAAELFSWGDNRFRSIRQQAEELFASAVITSEGQTLSEVGNLRNDRQDKYSPLAMPRLFGGFAFQDDFTPDNTWAVFHPAHFILPHYQIAIRGDESWLTINTLLPPDEDPEIILPELRLALESQLNLLRAPAEVIPPPFRYPDHDGGQWDIHYPMNEQQWAQTINAAVAQMKYGPLKKVVFSRVCEIRRSTDIDLKGALVYLGRHYDDCFLFFFEPQPGHAFLGASPELLVSVNGDVLATMGLAGSTRRGDTTAEDDALAQELLASTKDRYEHALVVQAIESRLAGLTETLDVPAEPTVYRLSNIQHLYTPICGRLRAAHTNGVLPLVDRLHPTPAMGGSPRVLALEAIRAAEPVPRGWYAAPIGWIDHRLDGAFAVGIRSAVCQGRRAWLYAGAGIVADSIPEREWQETALKFRPMLEAITGSD